MYLALHHQRQGSTEWTAWREGLNIYTEGSVRCLVLVVAVEKGRAEFYCRRIPGICWLLLGSKSEASVGCVTPGLG